jgi:hypothetical protein
MISLSRMLEIPVFSQQIISKWFFFVIAMMAFAISTIGSGQCDGGLIIEVDNVPGTYTPGTAFSFDVAVKAEDIASRSLEIEGFDVSILLSLAAGDPGVFVSGEAVEAPTDYLFEDYPIGDPDNGLREGLGSMFFLLDSDRTIEVAFFDLLDFPEAEAVGPNTRQLATVTVSTSAAAQADISINLETEFTEFFSPLGDTIEFDESFSGVTISRSTTGVVPEPASLTVWGGLAGLLCLRRRRREVSEVAL